MCVSVCVCVCLLVCLYLCLFIYVFASRTKPMIRRNKVSETEVRS